MSAQAYITAHACAHVPFYTLTYVCTCATHEHTQTQDFHFIRIMSDFSKIIDEEIQKNETQLWAEDVTQLLECLPRMHRALGSSPST